MRNKIYVHDLKPALLCNVSIVASQKLLAHGNVVVLESVASGKTLRVFDDGKLEGLGGNGALGEH